LKLRAVEKNAVLLVALVDEHPPLVPVGARDPRAEQQDHDREVGEYEGPLGPLDRDPIDHRDDQIDPDQEQEEVEPGRPVDRVPGDLAASARFDDGSDRHDDHAAQQQKRRELDLPQELEKANEG
jgi:hypothetical protein